MATLTDALKGLVGQLKLAFTDAYFQNNPVTPEIALGWPPITCLQNLGNGLPGSQPIISVVGLLGKDVSRFFPNVIQGVDVPPAINSALSKTFLPASQTAILTLSLVSPATAPNINDAVSLVVSTAAGVSGGVAWSAPGETLTTLAAKLASDINSRETISTQISATSSGATVTVTNISSAPINLSSALGNIRQDKIRFHRYQPRVDVDVWAGSEKVKDLLADQIELKLSEIQTTGYYWLNSGERVTLKGFTRTPDFSTTASNIFREKFIIQMEYAVTIRDNAYSILVLSPSFTTSLPSQ